uniref:Uncharacterized protein n=1 Tax=Candidatus Kentrum sp. MB TaxID=2138164 RepID=A0A450XSY0_9GAMM|nr:MAG: hypothetical protein BECKMB1821G_GA0114241_11111 [Candidatus Kentron sp. MB]
MVSEKEMEICHYITGDTISVHYDLLSPTNGHREGKYADREFVYRHIKEAFDPKNIFPILLEQPKIQHIQYKKIPTYLWVTCRPPSGKFDTEDCITNLACEDQELCSTELVHELGICHDGKCNEQILFRIVPPTHPPALYKPNWLVAKANPQWKPSPHEDHGKTRHLSTGEDCYREWIACPQEWFGEGQEGASPTLKAVIVSPHPIGSMNIAPYMMGR